MYFLDWTVALNRQKHKPGSWQDKIQQEVAEDAEKGKDKKKLAMAGITLNPLTRDTDIRESRSEAVDDNGAIYCKTDTYLDVCTYNDDKRGLLTMVFAAFLYGLIPWWYGDVVQWYAIFSTGQAINGDPLDAEYILLMLFGVAILLPITYVFLRYPAPYWRLEAFTHRRLIVRFNRATRKVYFLRPTFLGGVRVFDWDKIDAILPKDMLNHEGIGGMLVIGGITPEHHNPHSSFSVDGAFVGLSCRDYNHLLSFWEYIRRFMQDGPDAVPEPKRLRSKWPNPLTSMWTVSRLSLPGGFDLGRSFMWLRVVMAPVFFFWGLGHYASLLLSYEARFPKAIRDASHESEIRSLLALLAYNLLPPLYTAAGLWLYYAWSNGLDWQQPLLFFRV